MFGNQPEENEGDKLEVRPGYERYSGVRGPVSARLDGQVLGKQGSTSQINEPSSKNFTTGGSGFENSVGKFNPRPSTCGNTTNLQLQNNNGNTGFGLTRSQETSRATFRVASGYRGMSTPAERPESRTSSGKTRELTPEETGRQSDEEEEEEEEDEDEDEFERVQRENEESFGRIQSFVKRELEASQTLGMGLAGSSEEEEDEEDEEEDEEEEEDSFSLVSGIDHQRSPISAEAAELLMRRRLSSQNHASMSSPPIMHPDMSSEDLFDIMNLTDDEDNEEEALRKYFKRQHMRELGLENKREEIRRRVLLSHGPSAGVGIHRQGYWVYNPADYENLKVGADIKEVFQFITKYVPSGGNSQVDVKLKPFIPEYYPSVGDIDAFIKVIHPEIKNDSLGIKCLDEPSAFQSDPSVLDLRLRALAKQSSAKAIVVKKVENASKNAKIIENWINDISDLHRSKPSPSVHYSKPMPDIDLLIQEWPAEVEELLKRIGFPSADLDCDLGTYMDIVCTILDIPVYKSKIQSLHVLSTLYSTHRNFHQYGNMGDGSRGGTTDNLIVRNSSSYLKNDSFSPGVDRLEL